VRIHLPVLWLFSPDGQRLLNGGLERWCRDLAVLLARRGYEVTIYQKANVSFEREIERAINVVGVPASLSFRGNYMLVRWIERNVNTAEPFIFVSQELALSQRTQAAVAVNHGIWWDGDFPVWKKILNKKLQYRSLERVRGVACVDTNYINWCHAELPHRESWEQKLTYIPNYADLELFAPVKSQKPPGSPLTILFPRRVPGESLRRQIRGLGLLLQAVEILEARGIQTELIVAGRGAQNPAKGDLGGEIAEWAARNGMTDRIRLSELPLDEMHKMYAAADVVTVPSLAHEGTSLAAIEAIVCGKPTVVSHIGGLGNIVISGVNGYICDLSPRSLADNIMRAATEPCLQKPEVLRAFRESLGKPRWERQVWEWLSAALQLGPSGPGGMKPALSETPRPTWTAHSDRA
jgi:glycosyltransferase involved in cell wall biosynthesis